jgi:hypothetical protein
MYVVMVSARLEILSPSSGWLDCRSIFHHHCNGHFLLASREASQMVYQRTSPPFIPLGFIIDKIAIFRNENSVVSGIYPLPSHLSIFRRHCPTSVYGANLCRD